MEFLQLKYFQHAAKSGNFSHTADFFKVPPSCISLSVKRLESELGAKLFDRSSNRLTLNENGKIFAKHVDNIFSELSKAKSELLDMSGQPSGKLRVLVMTNRRTVTKIISDFNSKNPNISFILDLNESNDYKNYDVIITDNIIETDCFDSREFINEEIRLALPSTHPLASRKQINMSLLKDEKFISSSKNSSLRKITDKLCAQSGFAPDIAMECDDPFYIREYVKLGMGVSVIPVFSWKNQLGSSISLLKINNGIYRNSKVYTNRNSSSAATFFSGYIQNNMAKYF